MIPSYFIILRQLPVTPDRKLDKRSLPDPEIKSEAAYIPTSSKTEERLVKIWPEVLKLESRVISVDLNFFFAGGHSLNAITLLNKLYKEFNVKVSLKDFFMKATIKSLAEFIETHLWLKKETGITVTGKTEITI
jgi:acyl carrier protein